MQLGKFTLEDMQLMNLFEKEFRTRVVDYINDGTTCAFVVETQNFGAIIGKGGANIKAFQTKLGKPLKIFHWSDDVTRFARNLAIVPVKNVEVVEKNGKKILKYKVDHKDKAMIIGREGKHINLIKAFLKRHFDIENVVVE